MKRKNVNPYKWLFWGLLALLMVLIILPLHFFNYAYFERRGGVESMPANELIQGHFSLSNEQTTGLVNDYFKAHRHSARFYMTPNQIELKLPISYMGIKSNASFKANVEKRPNGDLRLKVKEVKMSKIHIPITLALSLLPYTDINRYIELNATHHIVDISSEKVSNELGLLLEVDRLDEDGLKVSVKIPYERVKHFIQLGGQ